MTFWKNDNFFVGATVALILILVTVLLLMLIVPAIYSAMETNTTNPKILLLAFLPPLLMMRYYMRNLKYTKSGSGAIFIIFLGLSLYFLLIANKLESFPSLLN